MDRICNRFSKSSDRFSESHSENKAKEYSEDLRKTNKQKTTTKQNENKTRETRENKKKTKQEKPAA